MSQENVEVDSEGAVEAFNRIDIPGALRFMDPEIRFKHRLAALYGSYTGIEGMRGSWRIR